MFGRIIAERISSNETPAGFTYAHYLEVSANYLFTDKTPDIFTRHLQESYLQTLQSLLTEARTSSFSVLFSPTVSEHLTCIREQLTTNPSTWNNYLKKQNTMKLTTIISAFYLLCLLCIQPVHADGGFWLPYSNTRKRTSGNEETGIAS